MKKLDIKVDLKHPKAIQKAMIAYIFNFFNTFNVTKSIRLNSIFKDKVSKRVNRRYQLTNNFSSSDSDYIKNNSDLILDEISELINYHSNIERDKKLEELKKQLENNPKIKTTKTKAKKVIAKRKSAAKKRAAVKTSYSANSIPHWTPNYYNNPTTTSNSNLKPSSVVNITPTPIYCYSCNASNICPDCDGCINCGDCSYDCDCED